MKYIILPILFLICSCNSLQQSYYGANREINFSSRNEYLNFICKETGAMSNKVVFLKQPELIKFMNELASKQLSIFYGVSYDYKFISATQLEVKRCQGAINILYKKIPDDLSDVVVDKAADYPLLQKLNIDSAKKTIVMIYSYKLGGFFKAKTSEFINNYQKAPDLDYVIVSVDEIP